MTHLQHRHPKHAHSTDQQIPRSIVTRRAGRVINPQLIQLTPITDLQTTQILAPRTRIMVLVEVV